jgi:membrane-associated phospholipid phosphatase
LSVSAARAAELRTEPPRRVSWIVPAGLLAAALLALPFDLDVMRFAGADPLPKGLEKIVRLSEAFSHGSGAATILLAVFLLDRSGRRWLPRLVVGTLLGGMLANLVKLLVARTRPRRFDLEGSILDSFAGWLPLGQLPSTQEGFPSAHAATGFALATVLAWRYPQGRALFFALAIVSGSQRVFSSAHFPSDVLFGAALGCFAAFACLPGGLLDGPLGRIEDRIKRRHPDAGFRSEP